MLGDALIALHSYDGCFQMIQRFSREDLFSSIANGGIFEHCGVVCEKA